MESHLFIKLYCLFTIQFLKLLVTDCLVVVSPLVNLMKDQVDKLANLGILAASLSEITEENADCCGRKISIARPEAKISPRVMISVVSQYVIGFTCHNESMLIGLFRQRQFADERKWLFVSADVRGAGTRDEP